MRAWLGDIEAWLDKFQRTFFTMSACENLRRLVRMGLPDLQVHIRFATRKQALWLEF